jgi:hypothetical protein
LFEGRRRRNWQVLALVCILMISTSFHERSSHDYCTPSRLFGEVKLRRAQLVVRLVTTCEVWVMLVNFHFAFFLLGSPTTAFVLLTVNHSLSYLSLALPRNASSKGKAARSAIREVMVIERCTTARVASSSSLHCLLQCLTSELSQLLLPFLSAAARFP